MTVLTDDALVYFAALFVEETTESISKIQLGSGNSTDEDNSNSELDNPITDYGCGIVTATTIEYLNTTEHPYTLHLQKTFTPSGGDIAIREIGILTSGSSPVLVSRRVYSEFELQNNGVVPDGASVIVDAYFRFEFTPGEYIYSGWVHEGIFNFAVTPIIELTLDPSSFLCPQNVTLCFNGIALRNGNISAITGARGGRTWEIQCRTEDYSDIAKILGVAAPVEVNTSITGRQYTSSILKTGTLRIFNKRTREFEVITNCRVDNSIDIEPFGDTWFYSVRIYESFYGDETL